MHLGRIISKLLVKYDCVVVPDFGAFIVNDISAQLDPLKHKFSPPSKQISFNRNLTKNDGLLIKGISDEMRVDYEVSKGLLKNKVGEVLQQLKQNKSVNIESIGSLFYDKHNALQFEQDHTVNYSLDSFGLGSFHTTLVRKNEDKTTIEAEKEKVVNLQVVEESVERALRKKEKVWMKVAIAALTFPFVLYFGWVLTSTNLFDTGNFQYGDLNPFTEKICPEYKKRSFEVKSLTPIVGDETDFSLGKDVKEIFLFDENEAQFSKEKRILVMSDRKYLEAEIESTRVKKSEIKKLYKYHVIGGCFGVLKNAERLTKKLKKQGYSEAQILDRNKSLYRVKYASFYSAEEAEKVLAQIKTEQDSSAWLLVK